MDIKAKIWTCITMFLLGLFVGVALSCTVFLVSSEAEEAPVEAWVLCQPGSYVNARRTPSKRSETEGSLETGYKLYLDGKTKNGYMHCVDMALEITEGWVSARYIVYDEPIWMDCKWYHVESDGRVAARKWVGGPVSAWLKSSTDVQVFYWSEEWCLTTKGYVKTEYLVEGGESE